MRPSFFHHLHPPTIPDRQARFRYTLAAGGLAVFLMLILLITGILEMFYYLPTPAEAGTSIQTLAFLIPYGGLVRNLHYWSAQFLVIVSVVHLLRVILTGSYAPPRRLNYLLGMRLLVVFSSHPFSSRRLTPSTIIAAQPPGPGFPTHAPST
jgi:quinol-cytochrome oxidoreductase complex cytochrome b subunit